MKENEKICDKAPSENIIAVINGSNFSAINNEYLIEMVKNRKSRGNSDWGTMVICERMCCFVRRSPRYIMKKLNTSLFIKLTEEDDA